MLPWCFRDGGSYPTLLAKSLNLARPTGFELSFGVRKPIDTLAALPPAPPHDRRGRASVHFPSVAHACAPAERCIAAHIMPNGLCPLCGTFGPLTFEHVPQARLSMTTACWRPTFTN